MAKKLFVMEPQKTTKIATVDEYIALQPKEARATLEQLRKTIKAAVPMALECISYQMPAYRYKGMIAWFAGYKNHYSLYPTANVLKVFKKKLEGYEVSKGTIRFPIDKPLPLDLITEIIKYKVDENEEKAMMKDLARLRGTL